MAIRNGNMVPITKMEKRNKMGTGAGWGMRKGIGMRVATRMSLRTGSKQRRGM